MNLTLTLEQAREARPHAVWHESGNPHFIIEHRPTSVSLLVCSDTCDKRPNGARVATRDLMDLEVNP